MHADGERELTHITELEVMAKMRAEHEAKDALHFDRRLLRSVDHLHTEYLAEIEGAYKAELEP